MTAFATRAYRRPPSSTELSELMEVFNASPGNPDQGLYDLILSVLVNPSFLSLYVTNPSALTPGVTYALDPYQLASRLSYFLWESMPDDALFNAAGAGSLTTAAQVDAQVTRMLKDPKATQLKNVLRDEYAEAGTLAVKDFTAVGQTNALRDAMIGETDAFFTDLIQSDLSPLKIISGTTSYVDQTLATEYGLTFPAGTPPTTYVALTSNRVGLGSQATTLANFSGGDPVITNPVKRGHFISRKLFCSEPPPPPGNIPPLPPADAGTTMRERLIAHVSSPTCAGCHTVMDSFGLGVETFDPFGKPRTTYSDGSPIDASGALPDGTPFSDAASMFTAMGNEASARYCIARNFMDLALARTLTTTDEVCAAEAIAQGAVTPSGSFSGLVSQIATSSQFMNQVGEAP